MKVWIQVEGEERLFRVEIGEDGIVDDLCDAILLKCPDLAVSSRKLVVYSNKDETTSPMRASQEIGNLGRADSEPLFVTVFHERSPPSSPSSGSSQRSVSDTEARLERWKELNQIIDKKREKKKRKRKNVHEDSIACSDITWDEVKKVFEKFKRTYTENCKEVPHEILNTLYLIFRLFGAASGFVFDGKEPHRLYFIYPILACVCSLLDDVKILFEENVNGQRIHVNGRFEFVIERGRKKIGIVEANYSDFRQGQAQALLGCEALSDVEGLDEVYGIVTNYLTWCFYRSKNSVIEVDVCSLQITDGYLPTEESLLQVAGKIYNMLSE